MYGFTLILPKIFIVLKFDIKIYVPLLKVIFKLYFIIVDDEFLFLLLFLFLSLFLLFNRTRYLLSYFYTKEISAMKNLLFVFSLKNSKKLSLSLFYKSFELIYLILYILFILVQYFVDRLSVFIIYFYFHSYIVIHISFLFYIFLFLTIKLLILDKILSP
jgi:hypothetical protein